MRAAWTSRGLTRCLVRAGASSDEDNARPSLNYEPGPAIINSGKHSFSYTQVYVVLSRTKRSPPMSFSIPVMVLIAGSSPVQWTAPFTIYSTPPPLHLVDDTLFLSCSPRRQVFTHRFHREFSMIPVEEVEPLLLSRRRSSGREIERSLRWDSPPFRYRASRSR